MKHLGLWFLTATLVLGVPTLALAQAPMATPTAAMPEKGEMKKEMKPSGGMMEKKSDPTMMKQPDTMEKEKKSEGMMEKKHP
jgi:hypothetical protein